MPTVMPFAGLDAFLLRPFHPFRAFNSKWSEKSSRAFSFSDIFCFVFVLRFQSSIPLHTESEVKQVCCFFDAFPLYNCKSWYSFLVVNKLVSCHARPFSRYDERTRVIIHRL